MNNSQLDKLTIIIFTYNRHKYLKRTINYWLKYNVRLLILDGSNKKFENKCLESNKITYIHDQRGLRTRLLSSSKYVKTEFIILSSDDEFYLPSALSNCIKFLLEKPNYTSCGGRALGFLIENNKIIGMQQYLELKDLCLDQNDAKERITYHFSNYVPAHIYSVIRSETWNKISKDIFKKKYNFNDYIELQLEFFVLLLGKSKIIPDLMWLRNKQISTISFDLPTIKINSWWYGKNFKKEKILFLNQMKNSCENLLKNEKNKFKEDMISYLFEIYIKSSSNLKQNFFKKILNLVPIKIKNLIKFCMGRYKRSLIKEAKSLEAQDIKVNYKELDFAISILEEHKNND